MTSLPPCFTAMASQMNLREEVQAKSRTFSALNIQVFLPGAFFFSKASASAYVRMITGAS